MAAGALTAAGVWLLLQLLFTGAALSAVDPAEVDQAREFGIGASIGSMLAPLFAMFIGGLVAGRLAAHYDRKVAGLHGVLVWAATSVLGLVITAAAVSRLAGTPEVRAHGAELAASAPAPRSDKFLEQHVALINGHLKASNAPSITKDELIAASHEAVTTHGTLDREAFVRQLDEGTKLSRPEAEAAVNALGDRTPDVISTAHRIGEHREQALDAAQDAGQAMLAAGLGLLLCLAMAIGGAIIGRRARKHDVGAGRRDADRGTAGMHHTTTAPYPTAANTERNPVVNPYGSKNPMD